MLRTNRQGQVIRVFSYSGQMRKHGGDRQAHQDPTLRALDALPKRAAPCNARGYLVRKCRG